mgnify:CR=1 FL=1
MEVASTTKQPHVKKMNSVKDRDYNIVLLGQGGVGKSGNLLITFPYLKTRSVINLNDWPGMVFHY